MAKNFTLSILQDIAFLSFSHHILLRRRWVSQTDGKGLIPPRHITDCPFQMSQGTPFPKQSTICLVLFFW